MITEIEDIAHSVFFDFCYKTRTFYHAKGGKNGTNLCYRASKS